MNPQPDRLPAGSANHATSSPEKSAKSAVHTSFKQLVWLVALLVAATLWLAGCNRGAATIAAVPTAAATATTLATPTAAPTATPTITPTPEPTITPGPSPTPEPAALLVAAVRPRLAHILPSPDESRRAEVLIHDCAPVGDDPAPRSLEILRIVEPATDTEYQLDSQLINCEGLGAFGLAPLAWSADGRTLIYTGAREGQPDGGCRPWARDVARVDLVDLAVTPLAQAAFSPDGTKLAGWLDRELVVYALDGGELGRVAAAETPPHVGPPVWSPDGSALAFLQYTSLCGETAGESAVALVDGTTFETRVLVTQAAPEFEGVAWLDAGRLLLTGLLDTGRWVYDLATGQLAPSP